MIWSPSIYMARLTNSFEKGLNHLFLPELFPSFPPSERGKLIPHSHSPHRAERHSVIILQQVPPIVIVSKTPFVVCQRPDLYTLRPSPSMCLVKGLIEHRTMK